MEAAWVTYWQIWESTDTLTFMSQTMLLISRFSNALKTVIWFLMTVDRKYIMNISFAERGVLDILFIKSLLYSVLFIFSDISHRFVVLLCQGSKDT